MTRKNLPPPPPYFHRACACISIGSIFLYITNINGLLPQGDGESAPDTPPPETAPESATPPTESPKASKKSSKKAKAAAKAAQAASPPIELSLRLDGMSLSLFVVSFLTRIWKLETPRGIV